MAGRRVEEVVDLLRLQSGAARTIQTLDSDFGLQDFEGRSYPGWHHHMTLITAAYVHSLLNTAAQPAALAS
jgi:SRSO17 transposase